MANGLTGFTDAWRNMIGSKLTTLEPPGEPEVVPSLTNIPISTHTIVAGGQAVQSSVQDFGILSGATMPTDPTLQTLRASGGLTMPQELKQYLPLILVFALFVLILIKK